MKDKITNFKELVEALKKITDITNIVDVEDGKNIHLKTNYIQIIRCLYYKNIYRIEIGAWQGYSTFSFNNPQSIYNVVKELMKSKECEDER
jgi:hypothetical protein